MIKCFFRNETKADFPEKEVSLCVEKLYERESIEKDIAFTLIAVTPQRMQFLNKTHYGKDSATEVLSFANTEKDYLGEVVVCPEFIRSRHSDNFLWELCHNSIHGVLHLLGKHHEGDEEKHKELHAFEKQIIDEVLAIK